MKFLDTSIESCERLDEARKHLNWGFITMFISFILCGLFAFYLYRAGWVVTGLYFFGFCIMDLVLITGLVLKREIYSLAILIKKED